jgi:hypothetical protein
MSVFPPLKDEIEDRYHGSVGLNVSDVSEEA